MQNHLAVNTMNYYRYKKRNNFSNRIKNLSVTAWLIIINILVYISLLILNSALEGGLVESSAINYFALTTSQILQGKYLSSLILHMFTHTLFFHLAINMFVLFSLGGLCERIIGKKRFIWFYLAAGLFAGILTVILSGFFGNSRLGEIIFGSPAIPAVGASGAIFGIAALLMVLLPRLKFMIIFLPFFSFPAYALIPAALFLMWGVSIILGLTTDSGILIGNIAHFGGFLVGLIYGFYLRSKYNRKIQKLQKMFR